MHSSYRVEEMITVFYDDRCSLCSREIAYYQKISESGGRFSWLGISSAEKTLRRLNISLVDALMYLHAIDAKGKIHKEVDAFALIWRHLPYFKCLSLIVKLPLIYPATCFLYKAFAKYRFARLPYCQVARNKEKDKG